MLYPSKAKSPLIQSSSAAAGPRSADAAPVIPPLFPLPANRRPSQDEGPQFWLHPPWSFPISLLLVALTTFGVLALNQAVQAAEPGVYVRPYTGLYLFPLLLLTWAGGRTLGFFTLGACCLTAMYFLLPPVGWKVSHPSDWVGLAFFTVTNTLMIIGLDALRHKSALVAAAAEARQQSAHFFQENREAQARLQSVTEAAQEQRQGALLPHLLLPELPARIAGLDMRVQYETLLKEGSLGTPFFDSFAVGKNRTALVVGAVVDSGPAAMSSVAMTRNMLRSAVYRCPSLTLAISELNEMLAAHQLLSGPARLFVVLYDAASRTASSVSCGRVPVLARRAGTGDIEELAEAGPLLGLAASSVYRERRHTLSPGDILLLSPGNAAATQEEADISCWKRALARPISPLMGQDAQPLIAHLVKAGLEECPPGIEESLCLLVALVTEIATE